MRRRHIRTVPVLLLGCLLASAVGTLALAVPALAGLTTDAASCQGEVVVTGDDGTEVTITQDTDRATVDPTGTYSGTGSIYGGKGKKERSFSGSVKIDLPAPLPDYGPGSWTWSSDASKTYATTTPKTGDYDLPDFVPRGFYVPLVATHAEEGTTVCAYEGEIKLAGSFTDSPISLGAVAGTLLFGVMTTVAGIARKGA